MIITTTAFGKNWPVQHNHFSVFFNEQLVQSRASSLSLSAIDTWMDILESQAVLLVVLCEEFQKKMRRFLQVVGHEAVSTAWSGPAFVMMGTSGKNIFYCEKRGDIWHAHTVPCKNR